MGALVGAGLAQLGLGCALAALGRWGARRAPGLVPVALPAEERERRSHALVVGGRVCVVAGVLLAAFAVVVVGAALAGVGPSLTPR